MGREIGGAGGRRRLGCGSDEWEEVEAVAAAAAAEEEGPGAAEEGEA